MNAKQGMMVLLCIGLMVFAGCTPEATQEADTPETQETQTQVNIVEDEHDDDHEEDEEHSEESEESSESDTSEDSTEETSTEAETQSEETAETTVKQISMVAKQWEFVPETVTVQEGDTVELTITSTDVAHGIRLPAFGVSTRLEPNEDVTVTFVADQKGSHSFLCSVPCGSGHGGMRGAIVVE